MENNTDPARWRCPKHGIVPCYICQGHAEKHIRARKIILNSGITIKAKRSSLPGYNPIRNVRMADPDHLDIQMDDIFGFREKRQRQIRHARNLEEYEAGTLLKYLKIPGYEGR